MSVSQGHDFRLHYLREDNGFASSPNDSTPKTWGADARLETAEGSNNARQVFEPASRTPTDIVEQTFDGSWSVTFSYTNPWWLYLLFGPPSTTENINDGNYDHTYSGQSPGSVQITVGREDSGKARVLKGCVASQVSVQVSVGNNTQVSLEGAYADEEVVNPSSLTAQPTIQEKPMTFADATLKESGSTVGLVQQGSVSIQNNIDLIDEWGSRVPVDFSPKALTPQLSFQKLNEAGGTEDLEEMYGGNTSVQEDVTSSSPYSFVLDNGKSGSNLSRFDLSLSGTFPGSYAEENIGNPQEDVSERISRLAEGVSVTVTNSTQDAK